MRPGKMLLVLSFIAALVLLFLYFGPAVAARSGWLPSTPTNPNAPVTPSQEQAQEQASMRPDNRPASSLPPPPAVALPQPQSTEQANAAIAPSLNDAPALPNGDPQRQMESAALAGAPRMALPIKNLQAKDMMDMFDQSRGEGTRRHEAIDIMAPHGTPIYAVADGPVKKIFLSKPGGKTFYQYDTTGQWCFYYAHLQDYAPGLAEGQMLKTGDLVGYVGVTGNSDPNAPHLHFALLKLGPEQHWYKDTTPVNPYPIFMEALRR